METCSGSVDLCLCHFSGFVGPSGIVPASASNLYWNFRPASYVTPVKYFSLPVTKFLQNLCSLYHYYRCPQLFRYCVCCFNRYFLGSLLHRSYPFLEFSHSFYCWHCINFYFIFTRFLVKSFCIRIKLFVLFEESLAFLRPT